MRNTSNNNWFQQTLMYAVIVILLMLLLRLYRLIFPPDEEEEGKKRQQGFIDDIYLPNLSPKFERFYRCLGSSKDEAKQRALHNAVHLPVLANNFLKYMSCYPSQWWFQKLWENERSAMAQLDYIMSTEEFMVFDRLVYEMSGKSFYEIMEKDGNETGLFIVSTNSESASLNIKSWDWETDFKLREVVWVQNSKRSITNGCSPFSTGDMILLSMPAYD